MNEPQKLRSQDAAERAAAAETLAQMGTDAAIAAVELVQACGDEPEIRDWAVAALEDMGPPHEASIDAIRDQITSENALVAYWAITLLGRSETDALRHQDALAAVLKTATDSSVRERAAWSLGKIDASSEVAIAALAQAAESTDARLSRIAKTSLKQNSI